MINKLGRSLESYWINLCESKKFSPNNEIPGKKSSIWEWTFYENPRSLFLYYSVGLKLNWFLRFWWQNNINTNWFSALKTLFKFWKVKIVYLKNHRHETNEAGCFIGSTAHHQVSMILWCMIEKMLMFDIVDIFKFVDIGGFEEIFSHHNNPFGKTSSLGRRTS